MNEKNEFKVNDTVTYKPYNEEFKAVVKKIENIDIHGYKTIQPRYLLISTNDPNDKPVLALTSGLCIKESKFFKDFSEVQLMRRGQIDPFHYEVI